MKLLEEKKIGVVAHFYMDPEVQGILTAAQKLWPHIHISDSLVMADSAVKMAEAGCKFITVLGVDFMSENVRAILDQAGFPEVLHLAPNFVCTIIYFSLLMWITSEHMNGSCRLGFVHVEACFAHHFHESHTSWFTKLS